MINNINDLHSLFKSCLDILRNDAEHLIGDEALNELSYFLILKQVEKHITNGSIDICNIELYKNNEDYKDDNNRFIAMLECVKFSKLVEYANTNGKEGNLLGLFNDFLWDQVLSKHEKFKDVFQQGKRSFIKESKTFKKLILTLSSINFDDYDCDILGEAYESVFVDAVFGAGGNKKSELGQFFTPTKVKKLLVKLVNPILKDNGEIESVLDPSSGSGGILNTIINHYKEYEKENKISKEDLQKQLIKNIYGIEIKGKIFNLCLSNMLINTGEILPHVICEDSIRKYHNIKVDTIVANPPFSVTIKYDELLSSVGTIIDDYIPINAGGKNSEFLFIQMMIHCLNINGRCATVMLDGTKINGTTSGYDKVREYLMKSCDLHEVILCPSGTFTSTGTKTCILFFTKKRERKEVLEIITSGKKRVFKFCDTHSTKNVKFYHFNPSTEEKHFIQDVDIDKIASNNYSLDYTKYKIKEEVVVKYNNDIELFNFGDVCDFQNGITHNTTDSILNGKYPLFSSSLNVDNWLNTYDYNIPTMGIIINTINGSGKFNLHISNKFNRTSNTILFTTENKILSYYIYNYLKINISLINNISKGSIKKKIGKSELAKIKIPIPSIEMQEKIVDFLDKLFSNKYIINDVIKYYSENDIFRLLLNEKFDKFEKLVEWQYQETELLNQIVFFKNRKSRYLYLNSSAENIKTLDEVCVFLPKSKRQASYGNIKGKYPFFKSSNNLKSYVDIADYNEESLIIGDGGEANINYRIEFSASDHCFIIQNKNKQSIILKYVYYYLYNNLNIMNQLYVGVGIKNISKSKLETIKVPIPSLEKQEEIVKYCEFNDELIKQLEKEIENNKKQARMFINCITNKQDGDSLIQNLTENDSADINEESDEVSE
jgi:type I restriction-modification system DNA methylase subunit